MSEKAMRCLVSGRVQGVSFRYYTKQEARRLGLCGWVRNLSDGRVEVLACGQETALADLQRWLHKGPNLAAVSAVNCQTVPLPAEIGEGFRIVASA